MRKELELIEIIEKYLLGELQGDDLARFEEKLSTSESLQKQVEQQRLVMEGVKNVSIRNKVKKAKKSFKLNKWGWNGLITAVALGVVAAGVFAYSAFLGEDYYKENIKYELNEEGTTLWSEADEMIAPQFYTVNNDVGSVLQTNAGMIIAVPDGTFLDENGNPVSGEIELEVKEALDAESIILAGLSTKSGDDLLETGGMFYLNGRKDGKTLKMNPEQPIVVEVPTHEVKPGMELYHGVRKEDGGLDWQDPKPIEQFLTPVDILSLDFYPPKYEQGLASLGYGSEGKAWKDSVYFSFGGCQQFFEKPTVLDEMEGHYPADTIMVAVEGQYLELNPSKVQAFWNDEFQNTLLATQEFEERMPFIHCISRDDILDLYVNNLDKKMSAVDSLVVDYLGGIEGSWGEPISVKSKNKLPHIKYYQYSYVTRDGFDGVLLEGELGEGWRMFTEKNKNGGPLAASFVYEESASDCFDSKISTLFSENPQNEYDDTWGQEVSFFENKFSFFIPVFMKCDENLNVKGVFNYMLCSIIDGKCLPPNDIIISVNTEDVVKQKCSYTFHNPSYADVDDTAVEESAVAAEQEPDICMGCNINQLKAKFAEFALQNKGRVAIDLKAVKMLQKYYEKHTQIYAKAAEKVQQDFQKELENAKDKHNTEKQKKFYGDLIRDAEVLKEEVDKNLDEVYSQLAVKKPKVQVNPGAPKYTVPITSSGWNNIDKKVWEGTVAREDINVELDGKTAQVNYEPIEVEVEDSEDFDRIFVYLLPHELSSFQRITQRTDEGIYTENLNEFIQYDLVVVGYKEKAIYLGREQNVQPKSYTLKIVETDKGDLSQVLHHTGKKSYRKSLVDDMLDQQLLMLQEAVVNKMEDMVAFRKEMKTYIFGCHAMGVASTGVDETIPAVMDSTVVFSEWQ